MQRKFTNTKYIWETMLKLRWCNMKQDLEGYYFTNEELEQYFRLQEQADNYMRLLMRKKRVEALDNSKNEH